jgi:hypothetical protein
MYDINPTRDDITKLDLTRESLPIDECKDAGLVFLDIPYYLYDDSNDEKKKNFFLDKFDEFYKLGIKKVALLLPIDYENKKQQNLLLTISTDYIIAITSSGDKWRVHRNISCGLTIQQTIPPEYYEKYYDDKQKLKPFRIMSGQLIIFYRIDDSSGEDK